ncbi:hypothetical protein LIER_32974 [Lithospermum erythrorhizon]|uniref:Uncharacterized protein n=1 Tax=Lithospermum erythrorhizon TaxID=34254 RepID=A0AAV3S0N0_LITER
MDLASQSWTLSRLGYGLRQGALILIFSLIVAFDIRKWAVIEDVEMGFSGLPIGFYMISTNALYMGSRLDQGQFMLKRTSEPDLLRSGAHGTRYGAHHSPISSYWAHLAGFVSRDV